MEWSWRAVGWRSILWWVWAAIAWLMLWLRGLRRRRRVEALWILLYGKMLLTDLRWEG